MSERVILQRSQRSNELFHKGAKEPTNFYKGTPTSERVYFTTQKQKHIQVEQQKMKLYDTTEQTSDDLQQMEMEKQQMKLYDKKRANKQTTNGYQSKWQMNS